MNRGRIAFNPICAPVKGTGVPSTIPKSRSETKNPIASASSSSFERIPSSSVSRSHADNPSASPRKIDTSEAPNCTVLIRKFQIVE
ncbi:hypothetical protein D3C83_16760 [compost metagenome]